MIKASLTSVFHGLIIMCDLSLQDTSSRPVPSVRAGVALGRAPTELGDHGRHGEGGRAELGAERGPCYPMGVTG